MSEWTCRYCDGGFPYPIIQGRKAVCPWCGQPIAKPANGIHGNKRTMTCLCQFPPRVAVDPEGKRYCRRCGSMLAPEDV